MDRETGEIKHPKIEMIPPGTDWLDMENPDAPKSFQDVILIYEGGSDLHSSVPGVQKKIPQSLKLFFAFAGAIAWDMPGRTFCQ